MVTNRTVHNPLPGRGEGESRLTCLAGHQVRVKESLFDPLGFEFDFEIVLRSSRVRDDEGDRLTKWDRKRRWSNRKLGERDCDRDIGCSLEARFHAEA